ncbi:unnamed protein product [Cylicostephanus goldi]|uniref:Uncharacterized protein n=1 Tax=Cylicostephanus goldi TaxID=71465 RepID=A0A3P6SE86_CYLGO|nr:unnamed protein product [Cylicostephanus goldi]
MDESPEVKPARVGSHKHAHNKEVTRKRSDLHSHSVDQPSTSKTPAPPTTPTARPSKPTLEKQFSRESHRRGSTSSTSPHRRKDSQTSVGAVERRRTSSSPRASLKKQKSVDVQETQAASLKKQKSIDVQETQAAAIQRNRSSQDSRRSAEGAPDHRRSSTTSNQRHQTVAQPQPQPNAAEKRSEVPHIKRVSISATHL